MTQEELDRIAQEEADQLLAAHRTVVPMNPEQRAAAEAEKALLASRTILNSDPQDGAPKAKRRGTQRPTDFGVEEDELTPTVAVFQPAVATPPGPEAVRPGGYLEVSRDMSEIDPMHLAELAEDAKTKRKAADALRVEFQEAERLAREAQSRFLTYLQKQ